MLARVTKGGPNDTVTHVPPSARIENRSSPSFLACCTTYCWHIDSEICSRVYVLSKSMKRWRHCIPLLSLKIRNIENKIEKKRVVHRFREFGCRNVPHAHTKAADPCSLVLISMPNPTFKRSHKAGKVDGRFFEITIVHARHT